MKKKTTITYKGQRADVAHFAVMRMLPNRYVRTVGPFFFLDYMLPLELKPKKAELPDGSFAHPHRGIATFTYLLSGKVEHFDSKGHHGITSAGGAQWMNSGNGIIHDEQYPADFQQSGGLHHGMQFWILLPGKNKAEAPDYRALQPHEVPEIELENNAGMLRVLIGSFMNRTSPIKTFTQQFNYHIKLNPGKSFTLQTQKEFEYAAFVVKSKAMINGTLHENELVGFDKEGDEIEFHNPGNETIDIMVFGGEPYTEPVIAEGPFVMNTHAGIADAYRDFYNGVYGTIEYENLMQLK
jgi:redox-sensitive bicupin YhaK (pirin superfamily)